MFISEAFAQSAPAASSDPFGGLGSMLPLILMFVVLWVLMIRPQGIFPQRLRRYGG